MSATKTRCAKIFIIASSLLLIFAASCSVEKYRTETTGGKSRSEIGIANPFCIVCHQGFDAEELALNHELAGIGCERCHGESRRHRSDEANIAPPEIMYTKAKINPTCMICHPRGKISGIKPHELILAGAETVFDRRGGDSASNAANSARYCTDCHGKGHRMNVRNTLWNKATGELITR